ncbi:MAG TPA: hypothetical protein VGI27_01870 [Solirubrobacteraceae bacterium]
MSEGQPVPYDVGRLIDKWGFDSPLVGFIDAGQQRHPCPWCERRLRPCNLKRHISAQHFRQLSIDDELRACFACGKPVPGPLPDPGEVLMHERCAQILAGGQP